MSTITTTLVSGQNAYVGVVTSRTPDTLTISTGTPGADGANGADGIGITSAQVISGNLVITYSNSAVFNLGSIIGGTGATGANGTNGTNGTNGADFTPSNTYTWSGVQTFSNTVNFNGDINVNGNTNFFSSNNLVYTDALIELHAPGGNTANVWSTNDGNDIGLRFHYYNGADKNAGLFMDNGTWRLKWVVDGSEAAGQFSHSGNLGDIEAGTVYANLIGTANNANNLGGVAAASYLVTNTAINTGNVVVTGNITLTGNIAGNTAGVAIGYRDIPQLLSNTSVTIANTDPGKHYYCANTTSMTLTIANNTVVAGIPIGAAITVVSYGTGNVVITRATGVSLYLAANSTSADRTLGTYGMATIMKVAADTWVINGTGLT